MTRNTLTDKERIFALAVADGHTQYSAYRLAYNSNTDNRNTVDSNASVIANKPEVREYIERVRKEKEEAFKYANINDKRRRIELIWERIEVCREKGDDAAIARYTEQLAKLAGDYVNINKDITEEKNPVKTLNTEDLKKLLDSM